MTTLERTYAPHVPRPLFFRDELDERRELLFHVRSQDYFGTAATILGLVIDALETQAGPTAIPPLVRTTLEHVKSDLVYLQETHRIVPKRPYDR